jgi:hypothetical protein
MRISNAGNVGIGTGSVSPRSLLNLASSSGSILTLERLGNVSTDEIIGQIDFYSNDSSTLAAGAKCNIKAIAENTAGTLTGLSFGTADGATATATEKVRIDSAGNVTVSGGRISIDNAKAYSAKDSGGVDRSLLQINAGNSTLIGTVASSSRFLLEGTGASEAARIDSSGRLLVGTSTKLGSTEKKLEVANGSFGISSFANNAFASAIVLEKGRGTVPGTIVQNGDELGALLFRGDDGVDSFTTAASIYAYVDGTPGANDMPGRLVFFTTADGASSPTERMRINNSGQILIGTTTAGTADTAAIGGQLAVGNQRFAELQKTVGVGSSVPFTLPDLVVF